jgi:hypothetical protein
MYPLARQDLWFGISRKNKSMTPGSVVLRVGNFPHVELLEIDPRRINTSPLTTACRVGGRVE